MSRLPSLRGLQAFEAAVRSGSLSAAADLLGITPSAVSHRIRGLEDELGVSLFDRAPHGLHLTDAGQQYRVDVEHAFGRLRKATTELLSAKSRVPLRISVTSEIGSRWLMPRFHRFRALWPDIDTAILSTKLPADLVAGAADVALQYGEGQWSGLEAEQILSFSVSPVCTPSILDGLCSGDKIALFRECTIIRETNHEDDDWNIWLDAAGISELRPPHELRFADYSMAIAAALDGQGIALGYTHYIENEIRDGRLVQPFDLRVPTKNGYFLLYEKSKLSDHRVRAFRDWVIAESVAEKAHAFR